MSARRILVFADWFSPGFKAGGPIRSVENFAYAMSRHYEIWILTSDKDLGSTTPYSGITPDVWTDYDAGIKVWYGSSASLTRRAMWERVEEVQPSTIYLNSMFSPVFALTPLVWVWSGLLRKRLPNTKVVLAPRGMLRSTALAFKPLKKKLFLAAFRTAGIAQRVTWHATDEGEQEDIERQFGKKTPIELLPNLPPTKIAADAAQSPDKMKVQGQLRMIYVGRIHPIKNLHFLLEALHGLKGDIQLTIVGPNEQPEYWATCEKAIAALPASTVVKYAGEIPHGDIDALLKNHHIFALPTQGENFGHAIFEAFASACPVVISDQTPWRQLAPRKAGFDLPLHAPDRWTATIQHFIDMDEPTYRTAAAAAYSLARQHIDSLSLVRAYERVFE